jgi:hypothetical protein
MLDDELLIYRSADSVPAFPALAGLDEVDWSAVRDAYGPAIEIPALLRALVSDNADHREFACRSLFQTIWHQGNVFSATATAVPFLYKLLEADGPYDRKDIAGLLNLIHLGEPPFLHCESDPKAAAMWRDILDHAGESLDAKIAEGHIVLREIRRALNSRPDLLDYCTAPRDHDSDVEE